MIGTLLDLYSMPATDRLIFSGVTLIDWQPTWLRSELRLGA